ncbi:hypothetical protein SAMN05444156_2543 [Verrucomicrobium sp. GAS474]|uniref:hypothetical protein n=1 Tax=Verrucomicrobium sp. GAS474 TaxID=1882831 RepID=UPI0008795534|nr:hypothetical protein [Verrucomicrobium sp. GAS474]SDU19694.1 hypothetical protein SAMN05444156_2543 [Verrucomicrobium sp. GAS474]
MSLRSFSLALLPLLGFVLPLSSLAATAPAAPAAADAKGGGLPEVGYVALSLNQEKYLGKEVRVHGKFYYMESKRPIFEMRMGPSQSVNVLITLVSPEGKRIVQGLRNFSEVALAVTGTVKEGDRHDNPILIVASKIDIEGAATRYRIDPVEVGIASYAQIGHFSQRYLNSIVTMEGRFDFREPNREQFTLWRGLDSILVNFSHLSDDLRKRFLNEPQFSGQSMKVTGIVRTDPAKPNRFMLDAQSVSFPEPPKTAEETPQDGEAKKPKPLPYDKVLAEPDKYVGKTVLLSGSFERFTAAPFRFEMRSGWDSLEVVAEKLPRSIQEELGELGDFSQVLFTVSGTLVAYPNDPKKLYLVADQLDFLPGM